jgi:murein DD-endopeptidase MepM/ murein hydrolase activator NlpD
LVQKLNAPCWALVLLALHGLTAARAAVLRPFQLPTANAALFEPGGEERFFVGTAGKPWTSGTFGCVRTGGGQLHEGIDIRCLQRDREGEPTDPVRATADGTVAYINAKPSLSNFGRYIIVRHLVERLEIYSTYAHLREVQAGLKPGQAVKAGEVIATLGRSANTREGISKDRAHLHFELNLMVNERFAGWHKKTAPEQRNDHGGWNGQNFLGLDPRAILLTERSLGERFSLLQFVRSQPMLCRVQVRAMDFPWVRRYRALMKPNPVAEREGVAGYELALTFNGIAVELIPRAASELRGKAKYTLLSVNEAEQQRSPCGQVVTKRNGRWELASRGVRLLDLLTH